jgi:tetratricopeptide (TPR) repeat protein
MPASLEMPSYYAKTLCLSAVLLFTGCSQLERYERDIHAATREIQGARGNVQRAAAYSQRGSAYSEKARYSRAFKLVAPEEYERLFGLAIKDHEQAIALDPASAGAYYARGRTYYDRAFLETVVNGTLVGTGAERRVWFAPAVADFEKAIEKDPKHHEAWDMLGLTHQTTDELDQAIVDYTQEMALNSLGRMRLADAYCERGQLHQKAKEADAAIADYEKSVEYGASADGCSCDPYNPLLTLYSEDRKYDLGWVVVRRAIRAGKWVAPELLSALKKQSGRTN